MLNDGMSGVVKFQNDDVYIELPDWFLLKDDGSAAEVCSSIRATAAKFAKPASQTVV